MRKGPDMSKLNTSLDAILQKHLAIHLSDLKISAGIIYVGDLSSRVSVSRIADCCMCARVPTATTKSHTSAVTGNAAAAAYDDDNGRQMSTSLEFCLTISYLVLPIEGAEFVLTSCVYLWCI